MKRLHAVHELGRMCWTTGRALTLVVAALALVDATVPVAAGIIAGRVVGTVPAVAQDGWTSTSGRFLVSLLVAFAVILVVPVGEMRWRLGWVLTSRVGVRLDDHVVDAFLKPATIAHLDDPAVRDEASRAVTFWNRSVLEGVVNVGVHRLTGLGSAVVVTWFVPWAGPLLAVTWILVGRWTWRRASETTDVLFSKTREHRRADYASELALSPDAAKELRVFGLRDWVLERFTRLWLQAMSAVWERRRTSPLEVAAYGTLLLGAHAVTLGWLGFAASTGRIDLAGLAVAAPAVLGASGLGSVVFGHYEMEYGLRTVPSNIALRRLVTEPRFTLTGSRQADGLPGEAIRFERVAFSYPGSARPVLDDLDLEIPAGDTVAIVGHNGAGKTTLAKIQ